MKFIKTTNEIVSLENVKAVVKEKHETGLKHKPFTYSIYIHYFNNEKYIFYFNEDVQSFNECYDDIFNILTEIEE